MLRRRYGVSLSRDGHVDEDVDPNAHLVNIADCMLVLLLGVIVALISYYNVDLTAPPEPADEITGIEVNLDEDQDGQVDPSYQRRGTVYYDEDSGSFYFVEEEGA